MPMPTSGAKQSLCHAGRKRYLGTRRQWQEHEFAVLAGSADGMRSRCCPVQVDSRLHGSTIGNELDHA
jgi:hypothetical protein